MHRARILGLVAVLAMACDGKNTEATPEPAPTAATPQGRPEMVLMPAGTKDVAGFVKGELERGRHDGKKVLVYVGATWCDPCLRFKAAVEDGLLDTELAGVRIIVTDLDSDGPGLAEAGYVSKLVPLFARPNADGTCSTRRTEGGVKGEGAVSSILPRVKTILVGD